MAFDVTDFGAIGDGDTNDQVAIQAAIQAASTAGGGLVYFPKGTYRLESQVRVQSGGVILAGEGRESVLRHWPDPDNGTPPFLPVLFQKGGETGADPEEIRNVGVHDLTIRFENTGPESAGGLQFNACVDWFCERVTVLGNGTGMSGSLTNGIAAAWGSRDGVIAHCVVDGVSKPAFYLAWAERVSVVACVAKNVTGSAAAIGFAVGSGFDVAYVDCHAYGCEGNGFHISNLGLWIGTIQTLSNQQSFQLTMVDTIPPQDPSANAPVLLPGLMQALAVFNPTTKRYDALAVESVALVAGTTWDISLSAVPPQTLAVGTQIVAGFRPFRGIKIIGGSAKGNGTLTNGCSGLVVGTNVLGSVGRDLFISGLLCADNAGKGIEVSTGEDVHIHGCILHDNKTGIVVQDVGPNTVVENQTGRVMVSGCQIYDNELWAVLVKSANDVTIENTRIYRTSQGLQTTGIELHNSTVLPTNPNKRPTSVKIRGIDFSGYDAALPVILLPNGGDSAHAAESGFYSVTHTGSPEGVLYAPLGSEYTDSSTGAKYRKLSAGTSKAGWDRVPTTDDATPAAVADKLALRDGAAGCAFGELAGSGLVLSGAFARGAAPAAGGALRLTNGDEIRWHSRLAGAGQDVLGLRVDASDTLVLGDDTNCAGHEARARSVGSFVHRFGGPGRLVVRKVGTVQTSDSTFVTAVKHTLPDSTVAHVDAVVVGTAGGKGSGVFRRAAGFKRDGGGAVLVGSVETIGADGEDDPSWDVTMEVSGDDILVQVRGIPGLAVDWMARIDADIYTP